MGLKKNLVYSTILTFSTYLVPLVVFPYISRVLGPKGIGGIDVVESVINYSILFSMMGLSTLGIREIAKTKDDSDTLRQTFVDLFSLNLISTLIVLAILVLMLFTVPQFVDRKELFLIGLIKLVFNLFWIEWFFKGMENFRYITIRSVIMRMLFILLVFCFVRTSSDDLLYYFFWVSLTVGNAICNWNYRKRYVRFSLKQARPARYVRPFVLLGLFAMLSAVYTQLNVTYLGFVCGDQEAGYYTTATRLYFVLIALFSTLTGVMIPHMSTLVKNNDQNEILRMTLKTFQLLFLFALPVIYYMEIFSSDVIYLIAGKAFEGAVLPMRIVMFLVLIIGTEQIFIMQLLIPLRKDKAVLSCAVTGASVCVIINLLIVGQLASVGSAIAWVMAECSVLLVSAFWVYRYLSVTFPVKLFLKNLFFSLPYLILGLVIIYVIDNLWWRLLMGACFYLVYAYILEEKLLKLGIVSNLISMINHKNR